MSLKIQLLAIAMAGCALAQETGSIGASFAQLYAEPQPTKRGPLIVTQVTPDSPAAKAGIVGGDIVMAVNGAPVMGRSLDDISRTQLLGPAGTTVRLRIMRDGTPIVLNVGRVPIPPHVNPASDPFYFATPGNWRMDRRTPFPLPWTSEIVYRGFEDLAFSPDFDSPESPAYHSYLFLWWIDEPRPFTAEQLASDIAAYFRGLSDNRAKTRNFQADLSKVTASYSPGPGGLKSFGGVPAISFAGKVSIYDTRGKLIKLNTEAVAAECKSSGHTALFLGFSPEPFGEGTWRQLNAVRDGFRCSR